MNEEAPFVSGPRHDYICIDCETKGLCSPEEPWRDLPAKAARCPSCGKKRTMQIVFTTVRVSTPEGRAGLRANEMLGPAGYDSQNNRKSDARTAAKRAPHFMAPRIVGANQVGAALADIHGHSGAALGFPLKHGEGKPAPYSLRQSGGFMEHMTSGPRMGHGSKVDTEHAVPSK